ncbi:uncharacterized protein [Lepisosteus oculatus]|uniref:uncharacterized protein isoform X2 n=1 Tax=Lepisosteus oculatus TaxID=7918 RepID=UPI00073FE32F|nr:PREDICTED: uncharacterized protein LOC107076004 isoform X1 [Lepisosteus oculatus]
MANCLLTLQTELHSFMEVLLKSIVYEISQVFRNRMSDSENEFQDKLRSISQILVRRAVFKITQCVEESFGSEMAQLKKENESLKWRLQLWEKESGAGGDQGQTDHVGHTLPCEVTAEIKEEMDTKPELSGSEASGLPDTGERAPLEQQHSEEEWSFSLMQETELTAGEGKETLSEQHTESRQYVKDLDSVPMMKTQPEKETNGLLVSEDLTEKVNILYIKTITINFNEQESVSAQRLKEEELNEVDEFNLTEQDMEPQLIDPEEQQTDVPGEENGTRLLHTEKSQDREDFERRNSTKIKDSGRLSQDLAQPVLHENPAHVKRSSETTRTVKKKAMYSVILHRLWVSALSRWPGCQPVKAAPV